MTSPKTIEMPFDNFKEAIRCIYLDGFVDCLKCLHICRKDIVSTEHDRELVSWLMAVIEKNADTSADVYMEDIGKDLTSCVTQNMPGNDTVH